jgi:prepilin-type N-terminal cleavage/methylation domain-containing protein
MPNAKGYTLIELIVVVILIGIIFSFAAPKFRDAVLSDDLKSATRNLIGEIRKLRSESIQSHVDHYLNFDLEKNGYWHMSGRATPEGGTSARDNSMVYLPGDVRITDVWLKDKGKKIAGETAIKFTKNGYAQQSAIHLESEDGREFTIVVNQFLPEVKVIERYVEFEDI